MPGIFAVPTLNTASGEIANPLFEPRRTAGFGRSVQIDEAVTDVDSVLALTNFFEFQESLDAIAIEQGAEKQKHGGYGQHEPPGLPEGRQHFDG